MLKGVKSMRTKEELSALKEEVETLNAKLAELNEVTGGGLSDPFYSSLSTYSCGDAGFSPQSKYQHHS